MNNGEFKPYIPADKVMPEFTLFSVVFGCIVAVVFCGANAYLGLRIGMTISASIPAAVISMGVVRKIFKRDSILENNMVQTIGSAGESLASGVIFTIPALFLWANEGIGVSPSVLTIGILAIAGGALGVLLMIPLRNSLIVKEHETLKYPEGTACAQVLMVGEEGSSKSKSVFAGLGIAVVYKFLVDGIKLVPSQITYGISKLKGAGLGLNISPALIGVGYICGTKVSSYMFSGGLIAWLVLMPLIVTFGGDTVIAPATQSVGEIWNANGLDGIWDNYIRYIGAGALISAGIISLIKSLPTIVDTFKSTLGGYRTEKSTSLKRTEQDLSMKIVILASLAIIFFLWICPPVNINWIGALLILVFGFFFCTVSSRLVGIIGASNNPASGMCIASLLITATILKVLGYEGSNGLIMCITICSVVCIIVTMAGDTSQDLKTGFLVGATPKKQQVGELIGVVIVAIFIGAILYLLNEAWGFGSSELAAPQATMMKMIAEGVMSGNLPWSLIFIGVLITVIMQVLGQPVLPIAIGIYLPIHTTFAIMIGGIVRWFVEKKKYSSEKKKEDANQIGILYSSGLIAGEGIVGILLAFFQLLTVNGKSIGDILDCSSFINFGNIGSILFFIVITASLTFVVFRSTKERS